MAQLGGGDDGGIGDVDVVVFLVALFQAAQDGDGGFHRGLADQDFLETALQRGVFLDVFAVLVERGRAHAMQFATRQRGFKHVAGVHRALGLAGTHHGVQFVNENNGLALVLGQVLEHVLQALLELATELGTGQQRGHVQAQHAFALERLWHLTGHDALRQAFDDGRFADTGLANQDGIVLGAALQHLDGAANFVVTANHRVELALARALGQVKAVFLERLALVFGIGAVHVLAAAHRLNGGFQALARQAVGAGHVAQGALGIRHRQQKQLAGNELVAALECFLFGGLQQLGQLGVDLHLLLAGHLGQAFDSRVGGCQQTRHIDAGALQQRFRAVGLPEHGHQQVHGLDVGVVLAQRQALRVAQGFLEFGGQFILSHKSSLRIGLFSR